MTNLLLAVGVVVFAVGVAWLLSSLWFDNYMDDIDARDRQAKREVDALLEKANADVVNRDRVGETKLELTR